MVLVDYKKASDMVDHVTLLSKLEAYKLDRSALLCFKSYLTDHTQPVSFKGQTSTIRTITADVPQAFEGQTSTVRAGSHFDISISISRHTQTQYDVDN